MCVCVCACVSAEQICHINDSNIAVLQVEILSGNVPEIVEFQKKFLKTLEVSA